ncbi:lantibiotic dehydratase [Streptomyces chattanoogensis]|uniref:lantibiotic dehydratase n=1 Tax=Streptomyces chattanoogensis TaxID=66876 RepID=UPI0036941CBB
MGDGALFRCAEAGLLRAPVHPVPPADGCDPGGAPWDAASGSGAAAEDGDAEALTGLLRELVSDPLVAEAVAVASPSLAQTVRRLTGPAPPGAAPRVKDLRRAVRALAGYRVRMATRATPFGLMAGVAPVQFAAQPGAVKVRWGAAHRRGVRPDWEWLTGLVAGLERRPGVLRRLRVVVNDLCFVRGDRLVLPYVPQTDAAEQPGAAAVQEVSVRHTAAVAAVMRWARTPVPCGELAERLGTQMPGVQAGAVEAMLVQLVAREMLLSEARPPLEAADPLGHVLRVLAKVPEGELPELARLREVRDGLAGYAARPLGQGRHAHAAVSERMRDLRGGERLLQVDLALDVEVQLPPVVAEEVEAAAGLLWRLSPAEPGPEHLRAYHAEFLRRYGAGRLVPVTELLDADTGLGPPAGYRCPPGPRTPPAPSADAERDRALAALAQEAALTGRHEVVLDENHPLPARFAHGGGRAPDSVEICAQLLAASPDRLAAGHFRLVLAGGSGQAAAMAGRFAHLLPAPAREQLRQLARTAGPAPQEALRVQVSVPPGLARGGNVAQVPRWLERALPVASFAERDDPASPDLADLVVGADTERLFLVHARTGRRVAPACFHVLDPKWTTPNAVRFLGEIAQSGVRALRGWDWAGAGVLPWLPRVRYGRTVLAPATWRPGDELRDRHGSFDDWTAALEGWRERWRVPRQVRVATADRYLELDLDLPVHRRLLRHELGRRPQAVLQEAPHHAGCGDGWLSGPDGAHRAEVVFPLVARHPAPLGPAAADDGVRPVRLRTGPMEHPPGGEWLYATVYCSTELQEEVLALHLPPLIDALPPQVDRWFFLRYRDADGPHLRLRFHAPATALTGELLPLVHDFAASLRRARLTRRVALDTYDPELERYGGPQAIAAAEHAFCADSAVALEQLRLLRTTRTGPEPLVLAAAGHVALVRAFLDEGLPGGGGFSGGDGPGDDAARTDAPAWATWLRENIAKEPEAHREFHSRRRQALAVIDPGGEGGWPGSAPQGAALRAAWARRERAVAAYGRRLRELGSDSWCTPSDALASLLHMHHNRFVGPDRQAEQAAYAIARATVQAHFDRARHGR